MGRDDGRQDGLAASGLAADPRVAEAKRLLKEALAAHQAGLTGIRPADPALKQGYGETLARFAAERGRPCTIPTWGAASGGGPWSSSPTAA